MKILVVSFLALASAISAVAGGLRSDGVRGAVWGGVAGAVIGHNSRALGYSAWRGAAIGAGSGLLIGSAVGEHRSYRNHHGHGHGRVHSSYPRYIYREPSHFHGRSGFYGHVGYARNYGGYGYYGSPGFSYGGPGYYGYSGYGYDDYGTGRPNYAANGALFGALAGAVIGHNSGDLRNNGWRGAGLGAAAGYVLGSIAENNARRREAEQAVSTTAPLSASEPLTSPAPVIAPRTGTVTVANGRSSSSMSSANSLFGR